jgi:hypothetical protein
MHASVQVIYVYIYIRWCTNSAFLLSTCQCAGKKKNQKISMWVCARVCACVRVCVFVCVHIYTHIYIYTHTGIFWRACAQREKKEKKTYTQAFSGERVHKRKLPIQTHQSARRHVGRLLLMCC